MGVLKYEKQFFIHTSFVDFDDFMRPFSIWEIFQAVAGNHAEEIGVGFISMYEKGYIWVVVSEEYKVVSRLPHYSEQIKVITWPHEAGRLDVAREYEIRDLDDNLLVTGIASWVVMDRDTRKVCRTSELYSGEFYNHTNYPGYKRKKLNLNPVGEVIKKEYKVLPTDLDHNGHMNNAKYFDMIYNLRIGSPRPNGATIVFVNEAKLDDTIEIKYFKNEENKECFTGSVDGNPCFNIEFEVE